jgi:hypothetical protein
MEHNGDNIYTSVDSFIHCCTTGRRTILRFAGRKITSFVNGLEGDKSYNLLLTFRGLCTPTGTSRACGDHCVCNMVEIRLTVFKICSGNYMTSYNLLRPTFDLQRVVHPKAQVLEYCVFNPIRSLYLTLNAHRSNLPHISLKLVTSRTRACTSRAKTLIHMADNQNMYTNVIIYRGYLTITKEIRGATSCTSLGIFRKLIMLYY